MSYVFSDAKIMEIFHASKMFCKLFMDSYHFCCLMSGTSCLFYANSLFIPHPHTPSLSLLTGERDGSFWQYGVCCFISLHHDLASILHIHALAYDECRLRPICGVLDSESRDSYSKNEPLDSLCSISIIV